MVFAVQVIGLKNRYAVPMSKGGTMLVFVELPGLEETIWVTILCLHKLLSLFDHLRKTALKMLPIQ